MKKCFALVLAVCMLLCGCGSEGTMVYVQSVADLMGYGGIAPEDRFAGMVVSENEAEVPKDMDKVIGELLVKVGDDVEEGQELFSYDTEQLQLALDKQRLELEQQRAVIENYKEQIADLEEEREDADSDDQLAYTIQIQSLQIDLKEAELNIAAKEKTVAQSEAIMENAVVYAPVSGRIQSINENGMDNYGNPLPYIVIQQAGAYRVKGVMGELQRGGIMEGVRMKIVSRTDESVFWTGTVVLVDYDNPSQGNGYDMYYGVAMDEMTSASKYPFYVELDSTEGLLLGQHVYMEVDQGEEEEMGVFVSSTFICYAEDGSTYVWAEKDHKLEKRTVVLGDYDMGRDAYAVLEGLSEADYIAFPDADLCQEGAATTHEYVVPEPDMAEGEVA